MAYRACPIAYFMPLAVAGGQAALATQVVQPPPTAVEIRAIETQIELPDGADSLGEYIRYYFVDPAQEKRTIRGGYVSIHFVDSSTWPVGQVSIVRDFDDIPAPYDAGCGVVSIIYSPDNSRRVEASCSSSLELFPPSLVPGWMYALVPLMPIAGLLYFAFSRGIRFRRARIAVRDSPDASQEESK